MKLMFLNSILAQAQPAGAQQGQAPSFMGMLQGQLPFLMAAFLIIYFLMIRPQRNQQKRRQEMLAGLKKGDEVVTAAGMHGKIVNVADSVLTLEIANNVAIKIEREGVSVVKAKGVAAPAVA